MGDALVEDGDGCYRPGVVDGFRTGDPRAFGVVFDAHVQEVFRLCLRRCRDADQAEDLMSVVFLEAWRTRGRAVVVDGSLRPWLFGIAVNVVRNARRAQARYAGALERYERTVGADPVPDHAEAVTGALAAAAAMTQVWQALGALPERERMVAELVLVEQLTCAQAARALGLSERAVTSALTRARRRVQASLGPSDDHGAMSRWVRSGDIPQVGPSSGHEQGERPPAASTRERR